MTNFHKLIIINLCIHSVAIAPLRACFACLYCSQSSICEPANYGLHQIKLTLNLQRLGSQYEKSKNIDI